MRDLQAEVLVAEMLYVSCTSADTVCAEFGLFLETASAALLFCGQAKVYTCMRSDQNSVRVCMFDSCTRGEYSRPQITPSQLQAVAVAAAELHMSEELTQRSLPNVRLGICTVGDAMRNTLPSSL
jgi:hypothetical protein